MPVDAKHGRNIPAGTRLAHVLRQVFVRQASEALSQAKLGKVPKLAHWDRVIADAAKPLLVGFYLDGVRQFQRQRTRKRFTPTPFSSGMDVFRPEVLAAVDAASMKFAESTNATATDMLETAIRKLKDSLKAGLEQGEALKQLTARVKEIFGTPRADTIAATEASRATHGGQMMGAKQEGFNAKTWLASSDACELCLPLDGQTVGIDEAFASDSYGAIQHPPRHPGCMCSVTWG